MSINVSDRVRVIRAEGEQAPLIGAIGKVERIYSLATGDIAIVQILPDEMIAREIFVKLPVEYLEKVGSQTQETEIPEGAKKISEADFEAALEELTDPGKMLSGRSNAMVGFTRLLTAKLVGDGVKAKIFKDQDIVVMTEEEFSAVLWDACNPVAVDEITGNKMGAAKTLKIAITAIITLEEIVGILFGGSEERE